MLVLRRAEQALGRSAKALGAVFAVAGCLMVTPVAAQAADSSQQIASLPTTQALTMVASPRRVVQSVEETSAWTKLLFFAGLAGAAGFVYLQKPAQRKKRLEPKVLAILERYKLGADGQLGRDYTVSVCSTKGELCVRPNGGRARFVPLCPADVPVVAKTVAAWQGTTRQGPSLG